MKSTKLFLLLFGSLLVMPSAARAQAEEGEGCFFCTTFGGEIAICYEDDPSNFYGIAACLPIEGTNVCITGGECWEDGGEGDPPVYAFLSGSATLRMVGLMNSLEPDPHNMVAGTTLVRACHGVVVQRRYADSQMHRVRESTDLIVL